MAKDKKIVSGRFVILVFLVSILVFTVCMFAILGTQERNRHKHETRYDYHAYATDITRILEGRISLLENRAIVRLNQAIATRLNRKTRCLILFKNSPLEKIGDYGTCLGLPVITHPTTMQWLVSPEYLIIKIDVFERFTAHLIVTNEHDIKLRDGKLKIDFKPEHFRPYVIPAVTAGILSALFLTGLLVTVRMRQDALSQGKFLADTVHDTKNMLERWLVTSEMIKRSVDNKQKIRAIAGDMAAFAKLRQICAYMTPPEPVLSNVDEIVDTVIKGVLVEYDLEILTGTRDCSTEIVTRGPVLTSVLKNLLENAAREAQDLYKKVDFSIWSDSEQTFFKIENDCDHLVDFSRIMTRGWSSSGSTGQGTAIASESVRLLGGKLEYAQNSETKVVTFSFSLKNKPESGAV